MDNSQAGQVPSTCILRHSVFHTLGEISFQRAQSDRSPVLVFKLGDREAQLPLDSMRREFQLSDESDDGQMLGWIAQALDYVSLISPGDRLPQEITSGAASWEPDDRHRQLAAARLQLQLVDWLGGSTAPTPDRSGAAPLSATEDPAVRRQIQQALGEAARALGLQRPEDALGALEELAGELAYVEALRERLLMAVGLFSDKLDRMLRDWRGDSARLETFTQVQRLTRIGLKQIRERFEELDAQTGEIISVLGNVASQRSFIRSQRDWMYRSYRAWQPILDAWASVAERVNEDIWPLLGRTYQFLAPRFMPATEWLTTTRQHRRRTPGRPQMVW